MSEQRGWRHLGRRALGEARRSPTAQGLATGAGAALAARATGVPAARALALGGALASARRSQAADALGVRREVRNALGAPALTAVCPPGTFYGGRAIEPDLASLVAEELRRGPRAVVEFGAGASTLMNAALLAAGGGEPGRLVTIEDDAGFAALIRSELERHGLAGHADVVHAPLTEDDFEGRRVAWYDRATVAAHLPAEVDVVLVDGPMAAGTWARWPVMPVIRERLRPGGVVLLDDGRRPSETRTVFDWTDRWPELELYWVDTVKGTWRVVRGPAATAPGGPAALARRVARTINPRPQGFGLGSIRR